MGLRKRAKLRAAMCMASLVTLACLLETGCQTHDDAVAAGSQMALTAKALSDYYAALVVDLAKTDELYELQAAVVQLPYEPPDKKELADHTAAMRSRAAFATAFAELVESFGKLTGSTAETDVPASAAKLETAVDGLVVHKAGTMEQKAIKAGLEMMVRAVQEKKERDAARAIDAIATGLAGLFAEEATTYNGFAKGYVQTARGLALALAQTGQTDSGGLLAVALEPFGMTGKVTSADMQQKLLLIEQQQINTKADALEQASAKATAAMEDSLAVMQKRVHLVATDKPMRVRIAPVSLNGVEAWVKGANAY
jgi:hypothetical protein